MKKHGKKHESWTDFLHFKDISPTHVSQNTIFEQYYYMIHSKLVAFHKCSK